jgi:hypothetical protein
MAKETMPGRNGGTLNKGGASNQGRPRKLPELREIMGSVLGDEKNDTSAAEAILMSLRQKAIKGDVQAAKLMLEYAYGKPSQSIDLTSKGDKIGNTDFMNLPIEARLEIIQIMNQHKTAESDETPGTKA